jgi:hypothetical protein
MNGFVGCALWLTFLFFVTVPLVALSIGGTVGAIASGHWYFAPLGPAVFFGAIWSCAKVLDWTTKPKPKP